MTENPDPATTIRRTALRLIGSAREGDTKDDKKPFDHSNTAFGHRDAGVHDAVGITIAMTVVILARHDPSKFFLKCRSSPVTRV